MISTYKKIKLTQNKYALVDEADFAWLNQWKWRYSHGYAVRENYLGSYKSENINMHRLINGTPGGFITDHINRNPLDNRRSNLRTATRSLNAINTGVRTDNKSGRKGVYWEAWSKKWRAELMVNSKKIRLGRFKKMEDAIKARKQAEKVYHAI